VLDCLPIFQTQSIGNVPISLNDRITYELQLFCAPPSGLSSAARAFYVRRL
jgi:hypothetical protein